MLKRDLHLDIFVFSVKNVFRNILLIPVKLSVLVITPLSYFIHLFLFYIFNVPKSIRDVTIVVCVKKAERRLPVRLSSAVKRSERLLRCATDF